MCLLLLLMSRLFLLAQLRLRDKEFVLHCPYSCTNSEFLERGMSDFNKIGRVIGKNIFRKKNARHLAIFFSCCCEHQYFLVASVNINARQFPNVNINTFLLFHGWRCGLSSCLCLFSMRFDQSIVSALIATTPPPVNCRSLSWDFRRMLVSTAESKNQ